MEMTPGKVRRGFSGLPAIITETWAASGVSRHLPHPRGQRSGRMKAFIADRKGVVFWCKRLQLGKYRRSCRDTDSMEVTEQKFALLFAGRDFRACSEMYSIPFRVGRVVQYQPRNIRG